MGSLSVKSFPLGSMSFSGLFEVNSYLLNVRGFSGSPSKVSIDWKRPRVGFIHLARRYMRPVSESRYSASILRYDSPCSSEKNIAGLGFQPPCPLSRSLNFQRTAHVSYVKFFQYKPVRDFPKYTIVTDSLAPWYTWGPPRPLLPAVRGKINNSKTAPKGR